MDLLLGGDLRYHLNKAKTFTEQQTKFIVASVILALEYLHENKVIHRDLKPENLVFDQDGFLRLTDLGISRKYSKNNFAETSGTPSYMAPEVLTK